MDISNLLFFDDGMCVSITELITSNGSYSIGIEPISNLLEIPTLLPKLHNRFVEVLLVIVIRSNPQVRGTNR